MRILTTTALITAISISGFAQTQGTPPPTAGAKGASAAEQEVLQAHREIGDAELKGDLAAFDRFLAEDYIYTNAAGHTETKAQTLALIKPASGTPSPTDVEEIDTRVRIYGDTAVITYGGRWKSNGKPIATRHTDVWVKREGRWQIVAGQQTFVRESKTP